MQKPKQPEHEEHERKKSKKWKKPFPVQVPGQQCRAGRARQKICDHKPSKWLQPPSHRPSGLILYMCQYLIVWWNCLQVFVLMQFDPGMEYRPGWGDGKLIFGVGSGRPCFKSKSYLWQTMHLTLFNITLLDRIAVLWFWKKKDCNVVNICIPILTLST